MNDGVKLPASNFDFRDRSLDRKLCAVFAQSGEWVEARHRSACADSPSEGAVFRVRAAEALRDEAVKLLAHGFDGRAAEYPLRGLVEKNDALVFIYRDDGVHCGRDDARQSFFAFAHCLLGLLLIIN